MKRVISILLVILLFASVFAVNASAALEYRYCGDVNWDGFFDTLDVTTVRRYLIGLVEFDSRYDMPMADFDHDGDVNIVDVTWMQRSLAYMDIPYYIGGNAEYYFTIRSFTANYDSGKALVGVPVTFSATVYHDPDNIMEYYTYEFVVDGKVVQERSYKDSVAVTFTKSGTHSVSVRVYNWQGFYEEAYNYHYFVVDRYPDDSLRLKSVRLREKGGTAAYPAVITEATGGTAPYSYALSIYRSEVWAGGAPVTLNEEDIARFNDFRSNNLSCEWVLQQDEYGRYCLYRDFSQGTVTEWDMQMLSWYDSYVITAQAQDAEGDLSGVEQIYYYPEIAP